MSLACYPSQLNESRSKSWKLTSVDSDILAELDLPASGITRFEETMPFPEFLYASYENEETINGMYYVSQTVLRKLLNRVHKYLYKSKSKGEFASAA